MPGYKGHLTGGVCAYGVGLYLLRSQCASYTMGAEWLVCSLAGSLFPDIDTKSKGQKYFYWLILALLSILIISKKHTAASYVSIVTVTPLLVRHRGIYHRLWFVICIPFLGWYILSRHYPSLTYPLWYDTLFFIGGAISHLWLDLGLRRMFRLKVSKK